jgi:hypothetical protein
MSFGNVPRDLNVSCFATTRSTAAKSVNALFSADLRTVGSLVQFQRSPGVWVTAESLTVPATQLGNVYTLPFNANGLSLSLDGHILAVGQLAVAVGDSFLSILTNTAGFYTQQSIPIPPDTVGINPNIGFVSLNDAGNVLAVGSLTDNSLIGAVWIYADVAGVWTLMGPKLTGPGEITAGRFGNSVSLNGAGNLLAVGCYLDNGGVGAVYIFNISNLAAPVFITKLIGINPNPIASFGFIVNFSADGSTLAISTQSDSVFIFTNVQGQGLWTQQAILVAPAEYIGAVLGIYVSLSGDGNILVAQAIPYSFVYYRTLGSWSTGNLLPIPYDSVGNPSQNISYVSQDGNTIFTNSDPDNNGVGASWIYTQGPLGTWIQNGPKLVGSGGTISNQGLSGSALSGDGKVAAFAEITELFVFV